MQKEKQVELIYAGENLPKFIVKSLFLAGPSPRDPEHYNWRPDALRILEEAGYDGVVFIPLPRDGQFPKDYDAQATWEQEAMRHSDVVVFWIARDLENLPAFTINVEFGLRVTSRNIVLGFPKGAPKMRYLDWLANRNFVRVENDLSATINAALEMIGDGAERTGGETQVPLHLWRVPHFQSWLTAQKAADNRLDGCRVEMTFGVGPRKGFLLYWAAHVDIYVAAENRNKSNEIVIGRPDIKHTVGFRREGGDILDTKVVLVREFRSTASTQDGFIREVPGGSGFKPKTPLEDAAKEFEEETDIRIDPSRLTAIGSRQLAGTTTMHKAHCFAVELTQDEINLASQKQADDTTYGVESDTERTHVEVWVLRDLLVQPVTDWSNLGMIFTAILGN